MKMKKILACVSAAALAVSAMAVSAFAETTDEPAPAKKTISIEGVRDPAAKICISDNPDLGEVEVSWVTATEANAEAFKGSVKVKADWWSEKEVTVAELIGETAPADVKSITFKSAAKFTVGYNTAEGWGQPDAATEQVITDMLLVSIPVTEEVEVNTYAEGEFTSAGDPNKDLAATVYQAVADEGKIATLNIKDTDVLAVSVTAPEGVDTSKMTLQFKGFTSNWKGWEGPTSEEGALTFKATVKDIMDANKLEKAEDVFGVNLEIHGLAADAKVSYQVGTTVTVEITDDPAATEPEATDPEATEPEATDPEATEPESTETTTADAAAETTTGAAGDTNKPADDKNEPTGLVLAVIPAAVAAAAVVIAKKRK